MKKLKSTLLILMSLLLLLGAAGCGDTQNQPDGGEESPYIEEVDPVTDSDDKQPEASPVNIRIASLKGPTTMGMVKLMSDCEAGATQGSYTVDIYGTADEIVPLVVSGEIDVANIPCNLASILYNRTEGGISVVNINTLGVLYIVETGESIQSVEDLRGKTIYSTGKGTTPEYVLNHILTQSGIDPLNDVTVEFKSEATEVAAMLEGSKDAVAVLPQPYVTVAMTKNDSIRIALDLTEEWEKVVGSSMVTGVTIVRNEFLEANPEAIDLFLEEYAASVEYVNTDVEGAAALVGAYDIVAEGVAKTALPYCNIVSVTGEDMKKSVSDYLSVLYESDPSSVGGNLPDDSFYSVG